MKPYNKILMFTAILLLASYVMKQATDFTYAGKMAYYEMEEESPEKESKGKESAKELTDEEIAFALLNMSAHIQSLNYIFYSFTYNPHNQVNDPSPPPDSLG